MPCYDKKLEAVRPDFDLLKDNESSESMKEVDTVLATHELLELFTEREIDIKTIEPYFDQDNEDSQMTDENEGAISSLEQLF